MAQQLANLPCETVEIAINGIVIKLIRPLSPETFILTTAEEEFGEDERLPYWAMLWPASIALARHISSLADIAGKSVMELGAGLALPALAASKAGAHVLATDWYMDALEYALASTLLNDLSMQCKFLDWRYPPKWPKFDYILGADLLYERRNFEPILATIDQLLASEGVAIFSDPDRHMSPAFFAKASNLGWHATPIQHIVIWEGTDFEVQCWEMRRA